MRKAFLYETGMHKSQMGMFAVRSDYKMPYHLRKSVVAEKRIPHMKLVDFMRGILYYLI